jgi:hypothetical protein
VPPSKVELLIRFAAASAIKAEVKPTAHTEVSITPDIAAAIHFFDKNLQIFMLNFPSRNS